MESSKRPNIFQRFLESLKNYSTLVVALATVILAIITYFYLVETRSLRKIAEQSFIHDTSPKVFINGIISTRKLNVARRRIEVTSVFKITNIGKTEAKDLTGHWTISSGKSQFEDNFGPIQYFFPGQETNYKTKMLTVGLNKKQFEAAKKAIESKLKYSDKLPTKIYFKIKLSYLNQIGKQISYTFNYEYLFHNNEWVYAAK